MIILCKSFYYFFWMKDILFSVTRLYSPTGICSIFHYGIKTLPTQSIHELEHPHWFSSLSPIWDCNLSIGLRYSRKMLLYFGDVSENKAQKITLICAKYVNVNMAGPWHVYRVPILCLLFSCEFVLFSDLFWDFELQNIQRNSLECVVPRSWCKDSGTA